MGQTFQITGASDNMDAIADLLSERFVSVHPQRDLGRILFLDIDGCIIPSTRATRPAVVAFLRSQTPETLKAVLACASYQAVSSVFDIATRCGAQICIVSKWRQHVDKSYLEAFLRSLGLHSLLHPDWLLPIGKSKIDDVKGWIAAHPEIVDSIVIDDQIGDVRPKSAVGIDHDIHQQICSVRWR
jgi:hypothetical protein